MNDQRSAKVPNGSGEALSKQNSFGESAIRQAGGTGGGGGTTIAICCSCSGSATMPKLVK